MKIPEQSVSALMKFGYSERESQFLYIVATFSGNFLRRQFTHFAGNTGRGGCEAEFLKKAISAGHVQELSYKQDNYRRYHLCARSIYRAIDKENSANRKEAGEIRAVLKLKFLDFVLDNFNEDYLEEEGDKVRFFTEQKGVSRDLLPKKVYENRHSINSTVRYFVDKFPLFVSTDLGPVPIPVFTYFAEEDQRWSSFPAHLNWYKPLLRALNGQYKVIYVGDTANNFSRAERQFQAVLSSPHQAPAPALLSYFRLRKLWADKKYSQLSDQDLADLNKGEKRFSKPEHEGLYQQWIKGEPSAATLSEKQTSSQQLGLFEKYFLSV
jgi:hypothetical protein